MDQFTKNNFKRFLKKMGKKEHVTESLIRKVDKFAFYIKDKYNCELLSSSTEHISAYAVFMANSKIKPNNELRAIALFFNFSAKNELARYAYNLRESLLVKTRKKFPLKNFDGIDHVITAALDKHNIKTVDDLLIHCQSLQELSSLSQLTNIHLTNLITLAKLSDLSRLGAVKKVRAILYLDAGYDSIDKIAAVSPETFRQDIIKYIKVNKLEHLPPTPKEAASTVNNARKTKSKLHLDSL